MRTPIALFLVIGLFLAPGLSSAQGASSGSATASTGTVSPGTVLVENDDIIQLNNLTITNISRTTIPATITAETGGSSPCMRFATPETSVSAPCVMAFPRPYTIQVTAGTILLLSNRSRASLGQFAVGDTINVYGFYDAETNGIEALIMRDLSKPVVPRYVQLEQMSVLLPPTAGTAPAQMVVAFQPSYCYDFNGRGGVKQNIACPVPATTLGAELKAQIADRYPSSAPTQTYLVNISANTAVLNVNRNRIALSSITAGDIVNVYGLLQGTNGVIDAQILRVVNRTVPPPQRDLELSLTTNKREYQGKEGEKIRMKLVASNNSKEARTLQFSSGCQTSYRIQSGGVDGPVVYNEAAVVLCAAVLTSVSMPPFGTHIWEMAHSADDLPFGKYTLTAELYGYGSATTVIEVWGED